MYAETVICKLYEARTDLGLTQQQVADGADMNVRTLINIEKGRSIPSLLYAMKLAKEIHTGSILVNLSGRGDKDVDYVIENYGYGEDHLFE